MLSGAICWASCYATRVAPEELLGGVVVAPPTDTTVTRAITKGEPIAADKPPAQHGQRESVVARAAANLRRIVAIEFGTWRSGRNGGSSGLMTFA